MKCDRKLIALIVAFFLLIAGNAFARDFYISSERGKGKKATIKKPAKDLGNIIKKLNPGDTVHIAVGIYMGKGSNGCDVIKVPVSIIGGYSQDFSARDPWGKFKTVFAGDNRTKNYKVGSRLMIDLKKYEYHKGGGKDMPGIVIDGIIIDQGPQSRYKDDAKTLLVRKASPKTGENPTPDRGALKIIAGRTKNRSGAWGITVKNCVIMNSAPTQGAMSISGYRNSKVTIHNNLVINNTGTGIYAGSKWSGSDEKSAPVFTITSNTVLFTEKYDAFAQGFSGNSFKNDATVIAELSNNVLAFADRNGIQKQGKWPLLLKDNIVVGNVQADYWETSGDQKIEIENIEDEAEYLHEDSTGNLSDKIKIPVSGEWARLYAGRVLIDRNAAAADVTARRTKINALRGILGLPVQAENLKVDSPVWLPIMKVDDAIRAGLKKYRDKYGCNRPRG